MEENNIPETGTVEVVDIQFRPGQKVYYFDPAGLKLKAGDHVIMDTARGPEFGYCASGNHTISVKDVVAPLRIVLRIATYHDERVAAENREKEKRAYEICLEKIQEHGLDMQLVSAEYAFDGSKILFFFTADERVDFRELVKNLASVFHTRIELRQIGVRDKAKMVGGLGICGRPFCCASFLDDFQPVSIKMAKTQNLSLNPTKISGTCGRLMCCLKYEQDAYEDLLRTSPKLDSLVDTPDGRGTIVELDLLHQRVKVRLENTPEAINLYANDSIAVLRSGKAKKNDPPIPDDLAPISGSNRPATPEISEENIPLDSIRFKYLEEAVFEPEPQEEPSLEEAQDQESQELRKNHRRKKPRLQKKAKKEQDAPAETSEEVVPDEASAVESAPEEKERPKKNGYHRRNHYRRRPRQNKEQKSDSE